MADVLVTCINKSDRDNTHESITHLGGYQWRWTRSAVIQSIENGSNTFYTMKDGNRANVKVVDGENGKYVRTVADGKYTNNLLSLTECPIA
jgi:hypothetical protein